MPQFAPVTFFNVLLTMFSLGFMLFLLFMSFVFFSSPTNLKLSSLKLSDSLLTSSKKLFL